MREIKFRAWNIPNNSMYQNVENGVLAQNNEGKLILGVSFGQLSKDSGSVLMQFTGLKDGGENEIYELDFVRFRPNYTSKSTGEKIGLVVFYENQWMLKVNDDHYSIAEETDEFYCYSEIVGNLYET